MTDQLTDKHIDWAAKFCNKPQLAAAPGPTADAAAPQDLGAQCDAFLKAHHFHATKSEEIVPGDTNCDFWLDDHLVKQTDVIAALTQALKVQTQDIPQLGQIVRDRWDAERSMALVLAGAVPKQPPTPDPLAGTEIDADWIRIFLIQHDFGPAPDGGDPAADTCVLDGATVTVAQALQTLEAAATAEGRKPAPTQEEKIARDVLSQRRAGRLAGEQTAKHMTAGDDIGLQVAALEHMDIFALLDALEAVRKAKQLDELRDDIWQTTKDARVRAAVLAVQHHLGGEWRGYAKGLSDSDQLVMRQHVLGRMDAGDDGDIKPMHGTEDLMKDDSSADPDWIRKFLASFNFGPDPKGDGSMSTCLFDGGKSSVVEALDTVVEQATVAGRLVSLDDVQAVAMPLLFAGAPRQDGDFSKRVSWYVSYAFVPFAQHVDVATGAKTNDPPGNQVAGQVTLELHPDNGSGLELSWVAQVATVGKEIKVTSIMSGPQAAWVFAFLDGALQLSPILQVLQGVSQPSPMKWVPTGQVSMGGQVIYVVSGTGQHLQVGGQLAAGYTLASGSNATQDTSGQIILQWKF